MKKLRIFLAAAALAASTLVVSAPPAAASSNANCVGEPNVCVLICQIGLGNKYTRDLFAFCYIW